MGLGYNCYVIVGNDGTCSGLWAVWDCNCRWKCSLECYTLGAGIGSVMREEFVKNMFVLKTDALSKMLFLS